MQEYPWQSPPYASANGPSCSEGIGVNCLRYAAATWSTEMPLPGVVGPGVGRCAVRNAPMPHGCAALVPGTGVPARFARPEMTDTLLFTGASGSSAGESV